MAGCSKSNSSPSPSKSATCDAQRVSDRLLRRVAERPVLPENFYRIPAELSSPDPASSGDGRIDLAVHDGPALTAVPAVIARLTPRGLYAVPTSPATMPAGAVAMVAAEASPARAYLMVDSLREFLQEANASDLALAIDRETPDWLVRLTLAAIANSGAAHVTLLFAMQTPLPDPIEVPAGFGPDDGMDVVPSLMEAQRDNCPDAVAAFAAPIPHGDPTAAITKIAAALPGCSCATDFALMEAVAYLGTGELALAAITLPLIEDASATAATEQTSRAPWSQTHEALLAAGARGAVSVALPEMPPPPPPGGGPKSSRRGETR